MKDCQINRVDTVSTTDPLSTQNIEKKILFLIGIFNNAFFSLGELSSLPMLILALNFWVILK